MAKPYLERLALVTATLNIEQSAECLESWATLAAYRYPTFVIKGEYGVVPAFAEGVRLAFQNGAQAVLALHDDVLIEEADWDLKVLHALDSGYTFGGFGGALTLGAEDIYRTDYNPMQLARGGFVSNMREAEAHGRRSTFPQECVCFDGFSQLGTKAWFGRAWEELEKLGFVHHFYDGGLGCLAKRYGAQPGVLVPVKCHHFGGRTAVANTDYHQWAKEQVVGGDQGFWEDSHRIGYEAFRNELPLRVPR
jgi:hypothetical protein